MYDQNLLSGFKALALEDYISERDEVLIMGSYHSIPLSLNGPVALPKRVVAEHGVGAVEGIQDETTIEALRVIVCSVDLLAEHASVKSDEHGRPSRMLRIESRTLTIQRRGKAR